MAGHVRKPHDCPYCWRVLYSKGALTQHVNAEHWKQKEAEEAEEETKVGAA